MILDTQCSPVSGRVHTSNIFGLPLLVCSIVTTTRDPGALTKSIAPPIPYINFPFKNNSGLLIVRIIEKNLRTIGRAYCKQRKNHFRKVLISFEGK